MSLFVGNLSPQVQHRELERTFRRFGRCNLELKDGYGFVIYETHREAEKALRALQGKTICRERPSISWSRRQRPFQRFSGKGSFIRRNSLDKDSGTFAESGSRRRRSQDVEKVVNDSHRKGHGDSDQEGGRAGLEQSEPREDANDHGTKEDDWKGQATTDLILEGDEPKESDPLDGGRWGELPSDGSPNYGFIEDARDYQEHLPDRAKEDIEGSEKDARVRLHGSPAERSHVRSSRPYHIADESRRGRDFFGSDSFSKPQERCYNCGQLGHIMRMCRSRTNMNMFYRDGAKRDSFDGRRHQYRGIRGNGFQRPGGRFRGIEGSRRGFNREMDASYLRRTLGRQSGDRRFHERVDIPSQARSRHRHHRSGSHSDSHSRERSKKRRRNLHKRSTSLAARKRRRSASSSKSESRSHSGSSSSSRSPVRSLSGASHSRLSKSNSRSLGSRSRSLSRRLRSASSRSHSASSSSRSVSHSRTSRSGRSQSKSHSVSSKSWTRSVSQPITLQGGLLSPNSHGLSSPSSPPLNTDSVTLTDAKQIEYKGELLETVGPVSKISQHYGERQVSKRLRSESEAGTTEGKHQEGNGDSQRGKMDPALKDMEELRYSSMEQDEEDLERSIVGSKDSRRYRPVNIGIKGLDGSVSGIEPSNGENVLSANQNARLEEAVRKQDTSTARSMNDGLTIDYSNAKQQAGRKVESPGVPALGGFVTKGAEHESILSLSEIAGGCQDLEPESFRAARLWPWEAVLHRRLKRGPISISNYERRKAQNEEFHIVDTFVRSSSGWWERTK